MGGGRSSPGFGEGGGGVSEPICELIRLRLWVHSLQPAVAAELVEDEILFVERHVGVSDPAIRTVQLRRSDGALVGTLADQLVRLLACMEHGFTYVAQVIAINDGDVQVLVRRP
jgi:hypothetical protein